MLTKKITVVIPAKNESAAIERVIQAIPTARLRELGYEASVLVVDSSSDNTGELAERAGAKLVRESRFGYGRAYKTGFSQAEGDIIATIDADMTYPVQEIPTLVQVLEEENLDFISTNRYGYMEKGAMPTLHRVGNAVLNIATRLLFRLKLNDSQSGMWVFRRDILDRAILRSDSMSFSEELKLEACYFLKCRWKEIPIQYKTRVGPAKIQTWKHGIGNLLYLIRKRIKR